MLNCSKVLNQNFFRKYFSRFVDFFICIFCHFISWLKTWEANLKLNSVGMQFCSCQECFRRSWKCARAHGNHFLFPGKFVFCMWFTTKFSRWCCYCRSSHFILSSGERLFNTLQMNINWMGRKLLMSFSSGASSKAIKRKKLLVNVAVLNIYYKICHRVKRSGPVCELPTQRRIQSKLKISFQLTLTWT